VDALGNMGDRSFERRRWRKLRQSAKLESVGILAGGVAQTSNNLLTAILGNCTLRPIRLPRTVSPGQLLEYAIVRLRTSRDLTRQLLAYAGKGSMGSARRHLRRALKTLQIVRTSIPSGVECRLNLGQTSRQWTPTPPNPAVGESPDHNASEAITGGEGWN